MTIVAETTRLLLKQFSPDEAEYFYLLNADPEVIKFTGDVAFGDVEEARAFLVNYNHYQRYGFRRWSVYLKESETYLGFCGLNYSPAANEVDVGFRLYRRFWNLGYATESAKAALKTGFEVYSLEKILGRAMEANLASQRVLLKLGMKLAKSFTADGATWLQY